MKGIVALLVFLSSNLMMAQTVVHDAEAKARLLGRHDFSLQWISWEHFGYADVIEKEGTLSIRGEQRGVSGEGKDDFVTINGTITEVGKRSFVFRGEIVTRVYHIAEGKPCRRSGIMRFKATGKRKYWRMQSIDNPCDGVADYVDLFYRIKRYALTVEPVPGDARIRVMNIKPLYKRGMMLAEGRYKLEVSKAGYQTRTLWVDLDAKTRTFRVVLSPLANKWVD